MIKFWFSVLNDDDSAANREVDPADSRASVLPNDRDDKSLAIPNVDESAVKFEVVC